MEEYINKIYTNSLFVYVGSQISYVIDAVDLLKLQWKIATKTQFLKPRLLAVLIRSYEVRFRHQAWTCQLVSGTCSQLLPFGVTGVNPAEIETPLLHYMHISETALMIIILD